MTVLPDHWARPPAPRRLGVLERWILFWHRHAWVNVTDDDPARWPLAGTALRTSSAAGLGHDAGVARNARQQWYMLDRPGPGDPGRRPPLASSGGPAGRPSGKVRLTKRRRARRRR